MKRTQPARPSGDYREEEKQRLVGPGVTVNGVPATVSGWRHDFATVTRTDGLSAEFAWGTIEHARNSNGSLRT